MDPHHRKIDLQSPSDFHYLQTNIKNAATEKLDAAIPPSAAPVGEDAYRIKVEELVQQYITQTLSLALPSLSINGLDASPNLLNPDSPAKSSSVDDSNYEPYDPRLAGKLRSLYAALEFESTRAAEMRREAPSAAAKAYMQRLEADMDAERGTDAELEGRIGDISEGERMDGIEIERQQEIERMWAKGNEGLKELENVTGVMARLERARKAVEVVQGI